MICSSIKCTIPHSLAPSKTILVEDTLFGTKATGDRMLSEGLEGTAANTAVWTNVESQRMASLTKGLGVLTLHDNQSAYGRECGKIL